MKIVDVRQVYSDQRKSPSDNLYAVMKHSLKTHEIVKYSTHEVIDGYNGHDRMGYVQHTHFRTKKEAEEFLTEIKNGKHPHLKAGAKYSIVKQGYFEIN
jgi:hypothetical protein